MSVLGVRVRDVSFGCWGLTTMYLIIIFQKIVPSADQFSKTIIDPLNLILQLFAV